MNSTLKLFASTTRTSLDSIVNCIDTVENNFSANNENHQVLQDKMTKIEDYNDIQDYKLNNLEVKLQKIEKLQYNNPWLDQSNQHISVQDNDYKTFLLLKSSQKDHHFNKFSHMFVGDESVKDHTCECSFSRKIQNFLQTPPEETNHHRGLSITPLEDDYYNVPVDESTKECVVSIKDLCVQTLANNFSRRPMKTRDLSAKLLQKVIQNLLGDTDVSILSQLVNCKAFWKRMSKQTFGEDRCSIDKHGLTGKCLYLETFLMTLLEQYDTPRENDTHALSNVLQSFQDYIFHLRIRGINGNMPLDHVCSLLPNLVSLDLQYAQ